MKMKLPKPVTRLIGKVMLKAKAHGPEACLFGGLLCGGAALVFAGINTWKNKEKLQEDVKTISDAKENLNKDDALVPVDVRKKELARSYVSFTKDIVKAYWLPATLEIASIGLIFGGRILFRREISALGASYAMLLDSFNKYRQKVIDEQGHEADERYLFGESVPVKGKDAEGNEKTVMVRDKKQVISRYARWFDAGDYDSENGIWLWRNPHWRPDALKNEATLRYKQRDWNDKLQAFGFVFLNDVLKDLGIPMCEDGQIVGWSVDGKGDGYIDFGIWPTKDHPNILAENRPFIEGKSPNVLLDFNVDGPILYKLENTYGVEYTQKLLRGELR